MSRAEQDRATAIVDEWAATRGASWVPADLAPILAGDCQDDRPSVLIRADGAPLLYAGRVNSIYAEPESLKSWLALDASRQELLAGHVVLYIDFEDSARAVVARLRALGLSDELIAESFIYLQPTEPVEAGAFELEAAMARCPSLVVIDGVTEAMTQEGLSLNDNAEVAAFNMRLPRRLARQGPVVLLLDHVVKSKDDRGHYAIGAQAKLAGLDGAAYSMKMTSAFGRGRTGQARLYLTKDRLGWIPSEGKNRLVANIEATSDGDAVTIRLTAPVAAEDFRPTCLMERVSRALEDQTSGASWYWIQKNVKGKDDAKRLALKLLIAEGFVSVESGPRNSHVHHSVRPYREQGTGGTDQDVSQALEDDLFPVPPSRGGNREQVVVSLPPVPGNRSGTGDDNQERFLS